MDKHIDMVKFAGDVSSDVNKRLLQYGYQK